MKHLFVCQFKDHTRVFHADTEKIHEIVEKLNQPANFASLTGENDDLEDGDCWRILIITCLLNVLSELDDPSKFLELSTSIKDL